MRFSLLREELRRALRELRGGKLSPVRGAAAVALGLFVGCQPIFGCHLPVIIVACLWLRLDALVAYVAANVSNPFLAPAILTAEVQLGARIRTGAFEVLDGKLDRSAALGHFARDLAVGAPAFGAALAVAGGAVAFAILAIRRAIVREGSAPEPYRLPDDAPPWVKAVERVAGHYATPDSPTARERTRFHYIRTKLLGDPVAQLVAGVAGEAPGVLGSVLDIGTGNGQLPILLVELGRATKAYGLDWDEEKVAAGREAAGKAGLAVELVQGDARTANLPLADTVLLIDLLHYFTTREQEAILSRAAAAVKPGGLLLLREADTERGLRSAITLLEERVFTRLRWNRGERVHFRPARELASELEAQGFSCEVRPAWGRTPFSNVLIVALRRRR